MATLLLEEHAPEDANILVLGAGGGLELKVFAQAHPKWQFEGIDPASEMLTLAEQTLGPLRERVELRQGYIDAASEGPFDGAACLLTLHFIAIDKHLNILTPAQDESILRDTGFSGISQFYTGFAFRGWVAYA